MEGPIATVLILIGIAHGIGEIETQNEERDVDAEANASIHGNLFVELVEFELSIRQ